MGILAVRSAGLACRVGLALTTRIIFYFPLGLPDRSSHRSGRRARRIVGSTRPVKPTFPQTNRGEAADLRMGKLLLFSPDIEHPERAQAVSGRTLLRQVSVYRPQHKTLQSIRMRQSQPGFDQPD